MSIPFGVSSAKFAELLRMMEQAGVREEDLEESFIRGGGPGGQKINKTASCVYIKHNPSGVEVRCQRERSQALNRFFARRQLCERMLAKIKGVKSEEQQLREKVKRQKRRRSRRAKAKMLTEKRERSEIKQGRQRIKE